jgi:pimeloyl-ACP methyl ester carboxylesterase
MRPKAVVGCAVTVCILASVTLLAAQEVSGVEHWVEHAGLKLYVWEKYLGSPAGKPVIVLAHGSATAGRESFDLQVSGKPSYSLMDALDREGFDVFALDTRGFGRSTRPEGHMTTQEASEDLNAVVDAILKLRGSQQVHLLGWSWGTQYRLRDVYHGAAREGGQVCELRPDACQ